MHIFYQALAEADAEQQANFFNGFYRHLKHFCKGKHENQICYISDFLDENGREFVASLDCFAKLALETRAKLEQNISDLYRQKRELENEIQEMKKSPCSPPPF